MARTKELLDPTQIGFAAEQLESDLRKRIVGQDEAIQQIISIYQTHLAGMNAPGRPAGNVLFLGAIQVVRGLRCSARQRSHVYRILRRYFEAGTLVLMRARSRIQVPRVSLCRFFDCFWFTLHSSQPPAFSTPFAAIA